MQKRFSLSFFFFFFFAEKLMSSTPLSNIISMISVDRIHKNVLLKYPGTRIAKKFHIILANLISLIKWVYHSDHINIHKKYIHSIKQNNPFCRHSNYFKQNLRTFHYSDDKNRVTFSGRTSQKQAEKDYKSMTHTHHQKIFTIYYIDSMLGQIYIISLFHPWDFL